MAAKIDNAAVQDCYSLYHNVILFDEHGDWAIIQQGMNPHNKMARRYHWNSKNLKSFVSEPHARIISECKSPNILNMTFNRLCRQSKNMRGVGEWRLAI